MCNIIINTFYIKGIDNDVKGIDNDVKGIDKGIDNDVKGIDNYVKGIDNDVTHRKIFTLSKLLVLFYTQKFKYKGILTILNFLAVFQKVSIYTNY